MKNKRYREEKEVEDFNDILDLQVGEIELVGVEKELFEQVKAAKKAAEEEKEAEDVEDILDLFDGESILVGVEKELFRRK